MSTQKGGARPTAGRKKLDHGVLYVRMPHDTIAYIKASAAAQRLSVAAYLDKLLYND